MVSLEGGAILIREVVESVCSGCFLLFCVFA